MPIKIALPKGRLLSDTAELLDKAGWGLNGYTQSARLYRLKSHKNPRLLGKIFHERDIPIQVAVGNYDLGICGSDWLEELLVRYPSSPLIKVKNLRYRAGALYLAGTYPGTLEDFQQQRELIRIASEYPNLAESYAASLRLRRFSVFPLWGAAEAYPPENAEVALLSGTVNAPNFGNDLRMMGKVIEYSAYLIANKNSWETKNMGAELASLKDSILDEENNFAGGTTKLATKPAEMSPLVEVTKDTVRLALPDGHQQKHTLKLLNEAGIKLDAYPSVNGNCRPIINREGFTVKVIRPQDMPLQVANGNFDMAITGQDWVSDHLYQFPTSPVAELLALGLGKVRLVAVVSNDLAADDVAVLQQFCAGRGKALRVASEYVNIADKYARDNHLGLYRVIPTWGATEAFLPEDADLLIENTETGQTITRHNLKIIDTLFQSEACLIGNKDEISNKLKKERIISFVDTLRNAVGG
ncbi:ATP phosphoribosyltransferase [Chloroflexota bacterium]